MSGGRLSAKVILITGIGGGQGRAAAMLFAREGAIVVGCDVDASAAGATVAMAVGAGLVNVHSTQPVDLSDADQARAWIDAAATEHGGIDVLYNNAATARGTAFGDMLYEDWVFTLRNELDLVFNASRAAWSHLKRQGGGSIVNTASTAGLVGSDVSNIGHAAGKGGVIAMTRQLATEGGPFGIRANCVTPGSIASGPAAELAADSQFMRSYLPQTPLRRLGTADDIAYAALYLASDESSFVTGQNLVVDGGRTITGFVTFGG
jgi:meso-butanediol dehydrogenase / (S,S)-butanediol dehydrogenase / diacetyl reductase